MITVKTKIGKSKIHGIGLFADEFIPKGTRLWRFEKDFDLMISEEKKQSLPKLNQEFIEFYYFYDNQFGWIILGDNARFINHSDNPNTDSKEFMFTKANRDIKIGEEIFENYYDFNGKTSLIKSQVK